MITKIDFLAHNNILKSSVNFKKNSFKQNISSPTFSTGLFNNINNTSYAIPMAFLGELAKDDKSEEIKHVEVTAKQMQEDIQSALKKALVQKAEVEELFKQGEQYEGDVAVRKILDDEISSIILDKDGKLMEEYEPDGRTIKRRSTFHNGQLYSITVYNNGLKDEYKFDCKDKPSDIQIGISRDGNTIEQEIKFSTYFESDVIYKPEIIQGKDYEYCKITETKERIHIPQSEPVYIAQGITRGGYVNAERAIDKKLSFMPENKLYSYKENVRHNGNAENTFYHTDGSWKDAKECIQVEGDK